MISGPDLVIACPVCQALAKVFTVENFDPRGTITWSDGWQDAPMMPRPPRITRCAQCRKIFWTAEAPQLGYAPPVELATAEQAAWTQAPYVEPLDEEGVAEALATSLAPTPDLEMELRVLRWWRGNDAFRRVDAPIGHATESGAIANMERIIEMMQEGEEDLLLFRAEAERELGRFDDALRTLDGVCCSDWWPAKSRLLSFIEARSQRLEILFAADVASSESPGT
jgi:hypothetical protein